jgi:type I site-specific restriction endonuclease
VETKPEDIAREQIDRMLEQAGWAVQDAKAANLYAKEVTPTFNTWPFGIPKF